MDWKPYITANPEIMHGEVCFLGTRIPVSVVLDNLAAGETPEQILDQYPSLRAEHIPAAISYAADLVRERILPISVQTRWMNVRFKLDENMPRSGESLLLDSGHDVHTALAEKLGGRPDAEILRACQREGRVLITFDLDFADIRTYPPQAQHGVWILRPATQSVANTLTLLRGALGLLRTESPLGCLWIVEHGRVRIRG